MGILYGYVPKDQKVEENEFGYSGETPPPKTMETEPPKQLPAKMQPLWDKWHDGINRAADLTGVDPMLILSHMYHESRGNPNALSEAGAVGLMQVLPSTADSMGFDASRFAADPDQAILAGATYIHNMLKQFGGNVKYAVAAYHDGPGNVQKWLKDTGELRSGERGLAYRNQVLEDYYKMRGTPDDYDSYLFPHEGSVLRSTSGRSTQDNPSVYNTPSERRAYSERAAKVGKKNPSDIWEDSAAGVRVPMGWYAKNEQLLKQQHGPHYEPTRKEFFDGLEQAFDEEPNSQIEDMWNAFIGGAAKSVTMAGTYVGLVGEKMGLGSGLLNSSLAGTSYIDRHFQVQDPDFLTQLAGAFGSTLPFMAIGGGVGWAVGRNVMASMAGKATATRLASALAKGQAVDKFSRTVGAMVGIDVGMTVSEAATEAGGVYQQAIDQGMTEDEAWAASNKTFLSNLAVLGVTNLPYAIPGSLGVKIAMGAIGEGYQENMQSNISDAALGQRSWGELLLPNHPMDMLLGAIVGGVLNGASEIADEKRIKKAEDRYRKTFGNPDDVNATDQSIQQSAGLSASQMSDQELDKSMDQVNERLETLTKHLNGEDQGLVGAQEDLQKEARRLQLLKSAVHNEMLVRKVQEEFEKNPQMVEDVKKRIKTIIDIANKNDGKIPKDMEELTALGVAVLSRVNAMPEPLLKEAAAALPSLKGVLQAYQDVYSQEAEQAPGGPQEGTATTEPTATPSGTEAAAEGTEAPLPEEPANVREEIPPPETPPVSTEQAPRRPQGPEEAVTLESVRNDSFTQEMARQYPERYPTPQEIEAELPKPFEGPNGEPVYTPRQVADAKARAMERKTGRPIEPGSEEDFATHGMEPATDQVATLRSMPRAGRESFRAAVELANKLGIPVFVGRTARGATTNTQGVYKRDRILLNLGAADPLDWVLSHEIGHHLEMNTDLRPIVRDLLANFNRLDPKLKEIIQDKVEKRYAPGKIPREVFADIIAEQLLTQEGRNLVFAHLNDQQKRTLLDWLRTFVRNLVRRPGEAGSTGQVLEKRLQELELEIQSQVNQQLDENYLHDNIADIDHAESRASIKQEVDSIIARAKARAKGIRAFKGKRAFDALQDRIAAREAAAQKLNEVATRNREPRLEAQRRADLEKASRTQPPSKAIKEYIVAKNPDGSGYTVFGTTEAKIENGATLNGKNLVKIARFPGKFGKANASTYAAQLRRAQRNFALGRIGKSTMSLAGLKEAIRDAVAKGGPVVGAENLDTIRNYLQDRVQTLEDLKERIRRKEFPTLKSKRRIAEKTLLNGARVPDARVVWLGMESGDSIYAIDYMDADLGKRVELDEYFSNKAKARQRIQELESETTSPMREAQLTAKRMEEEIVSLRELINEIDSQEERQAQQGRETGFLPGNERVAQEDIRQEEVQAGRELPPVEEEAQSPTKGIQEGLEVTLAEVDQMIDQAYTDGISRGEAEALIDGFNKQFGTNIDNSVLDNPDIVTEMDPNLLGKLLAQQLHPEATPEESGVSSREEKIYIFNDLYELFRATAEKNGMPLARTEAVSRKASTERALKETRSRTESYDTRSDNLLGQLQYELNDGDWVNRLKGGDQVTVDDLMPDGGEPAPEVVATREAALREQNRRMYNEAKARELQKKLTVLKKYDGRVPERIAELRRKLEAVNKILKSASDRGDIATFQRHLPQAHAIHEELDALSPSTDSYESRGVLGFVGDVLRGDYKTGRSDGSAPEQIDHNPHVQAVYEEQQTARRTKIDPESAPARILSKFYTWFLDRLHMSKVTQERFTNEDAITGAMADRGISHYLNMRTIATGWGAVAELFFKRGVFSFVRNKVIFDKGIRQILKENNILGNPVKFERLGLYMTARRIYALSGRDITQGPRWTGFKGTDQEIEAYLDKWEAVYRGLHQDIDLRTAAEQYHEFSNAMVTFLGEMGNKSQQEVNNILNSRSFYSPLYAADPEDLNKSTSLDRGRNIDKGISPLMEIDTREGRQPDIMHPVEAISQNTVKYVHAGYMNYVKLRLADMLNTVGNRDLGYVVDIDPGTVLLRQVLTGGAPILPNSVPQIVRTIGARVGEAMETGRIFYGIREEKKQAMINQLLNPSSPQHILDPQAELEMSLYIAGSDLGDNMIAYLEDGEIRIMQVSPDLMAGFASLKSENLSYFFKKAGQVSQWLKKGATSTPRFMVLNLMRDFMSATVGSAGMIGNPADFGRFMVNWVRGINSLMTEDEFYTGFLLHGGGLSEFLATTPDELKKRVEGVMNSRNPKDFVLHPSKWPTAFAVGLDLVNTASRNTELLTRLAVYRTHLEKMEQQNPGRAHLLTSQLAAFASREGTIDFSRTGSQMKALNSLQPFLTASLAGTDKVMRSMFSANGDRLGTAMRGFVMLTVPSLLLHALNHDQDWYREKSDWEKNAFWMFKIGNTIMRIPKPFDYGMIFASLPERIFDYWYADNPRGAREWAALFHQQAYGGSLEIGGWLDTILPPVSAYINARRNYNPLVGGKIVKGERENVQATFQYSDSTSDMAVWLSEFLLDKTGFRGLSPAKLDFWIRQTFGERGSILVDAAGKVLPMERNKFEHGEWYNRNIITKGLFSTDPTAFGSTSDEFYELFHRAEEASNTIDYFRSKGDKRRLVDFVERRGGEASMYKPMADFVDKAKMLTNAIEMIKISDGYYSSSVKERKVKELTRQRTELYQRAVMEYKRRIDDAQKRAAEAARRIRQNG